MKQFVVLLAIVCLFVFIGCGQGEKGKQPTQGESKEAAETLMEKADKASEAVKEKAGAAVETVKEETKGFTESVKDEGQGAAGHMKEMTGRSVEMAKEKTQEAVEVAKEKTERVLFETNMSSDVIKQIQKALQNAGHDPKYIDGVMGWRTTEAIKAYQKEKGLAVGGLTYETIKSLGIKLGG